MRVERTLVGRELLAFRAGAHAWFRHVGTRAWSVTTMKLYSDHEVK